MFVGFQFVTSVLISTLPLIKQVRSQHEREIEEVRKAANIEKDSALRIHKSAVSL